MWSIQVMKYYSVLKRKAILIPAAAWMNLEDMMFSETSQSLKNNPVGSTSMRGPE